MSRLIDRCLMMSFVHSNKACSVIYLIGIFAFTYPKIMPVKHRQTITCTQSAISYKIQNEENIASVLEKPAIFLNLAKAFDTVHNVGGQAALLKA